MVAECWRYILFWACVDSGFPGAVTKFPTQEIVADKGSRSFTQYDDEPGSAHMLSSASTRTHPLIPVSSHALTATTSLTGHQFLQRLDRSCASESSRRPRLNLQSARFVRMISVQ